MSPSRKKIFVAAKPEGFQVESLKEAAEKLQIDLTVDTVSGVNIPAIAADLVYWRSGLSSPGEVSVHARTRLLRELSSRTQVVNPHIYTNPHYSSKLLQQTVFAEKYMGHISASSIQTSVATNEKDLLSLVAQKALQFPIVAKPDCGSQGEGVYILETKADVHIVPDYKKYIFQNYIPNQGDYRVLVIGGVAHDVIRRTSRVATDAPHINNISQGGQPERVTDIQKRNRLAEVACIIADIFGQTVCGVDLLEDTNGRLYFLELNTVPQWEGLQSVSPYNVAEHILQTFSHLIDAAKGPISPALVRTYMHDNLPYIPLGKQFHFLSRCYLWSGKTVYKNELMALKDIWRPSDEVLRTRLTKLAHNDYVAPTPRKAYRQDAVKAHPKVTLYDPIFFKLLFDRTVYGGSAFTNLRDAIDLEDVAQVFTALMQDPVSLFTLSTPAVNFIHFCRDHLDPERFNFQLETLLEIADTVTLPDAEADLDARLYFYTHIIIAASHFYDKIPLTDDLGTYKEILGRIETLIQAHFAAISLDQKFEFLVCAELCNYETPLKTAIWEEAAMSLSPHGAYFVNKLNRFKAHHQKNPLHVAEHQNVLALMAFDETLRPVLTRPDRRFDRT